MSYRADKQEVYTQTDRQTDTDTQTQAMTIPVGEKALGKKRGIHLGQRTTTMTR